MWLARCLALAETHGLAPQDVVEMWAERAAIREFDNAQSREAAERDAFADVEATVEDGVLIAGPRRGPQSASSRTTGDQETSGTGGRGSGTPS